MNNINKKILSNYNNHVNMKMSPSIGMLLLSTMVCVDQTLKI